jgi:hypothetical protein
VKIRPPSSVVPITMSWVLLVLAIVFGAMTPRRP